MIQHFDLKKGNMKKHQDKGENKQRQQYQASILIMYLLESVLRYEKINICESIGFLTIFDCDNVVLIRTDDEKKWSFVLKKVFLML